MSRQLALFMTAVQFLTRLPTPRFAAFGYRRGRAGPPSVARLRWDELADEQAAVYRSVLDGQSAGGRRGRPWPDRLRPHQLRPHQLRPDQPGLDRLGLDRLRRRFARRR